MTELPMAVEERLSRLAPDQRGAATARAGPVLCVAPAGSGKTTTLVARKSLLLVYDPAVPSPFLREAFDADELAA